MIGRLPSTRTGRTIPPRGASSRRPGIGWLGVAAFALACGGGGWGPTAQAQAQPSASNPLPPSRPRPNPVPARPAPAPAPTEVPADLPDDAPPPREELDPGALRLRAPTGTEAPAPRRDSEVDRVAAPEAEAALEDGNPLPGAVARPPGSAAPPGSGPAGADPADPFVLKPDRLSTGKQQVVLAVEVRAAPVINLGKEAPVRIVVTNTGSTDVYGVSVVYQLPESLQFASSESPSHQDPINPRIYTWNKPMMAAGGEWSIGLKVVARDTKACEHVAHVRAQVGSKAPTMIQEPKLRVEAVASPGRLLKGNQVKFEITVSNPGTGPARNVNVQAMLSDGLKLGEDNLVEQMIDVIQPGERKLLDPLILDTVAGGQQTCGIVVRSPDVNVVAADHKIERTVEVTKPELKVDLTGQEFRYTGQSNEYKLTVKNTGTAPAKKVVISAAMPQQGGKLAPGPLPRGAVFKVKERKLIWEIGQLEPGQEIENQFVYETSTPGLYRCSAEAIAGPLRASSTMTTEVSGIADLDLKVSQTDRVIDVGKTTYYDFVIQNVGSKEATKLLLSGTLVNLEVTKPFFEESFGKFEAKPDAGKQTCQFFFPAIPRLAAGQSITLSLEVKALRGGKASASVGLAHDDMGDDEHAKIKGAITTTVTDLSRPPPR